LLSNVMKYFICFYVLIFIYLMWVLRKMDGMIDGMKPVLVITISIPDSVHLQK
jgi:hypothetical protein